MKEDNNDEEANNIDLEPVVSPPSKENNSPPLAPAEQGDDTDVCIILNNDIKCKVKNDRHSCVCSLSNCKQP